MKNWTNLLAGDYGGERKSNSQRQAQHRARKRKAGLIKLELWVTPEEKEAILAALNDIRANQTYSPVLDAIK